MKLTIKTSTKDLVVETQNWDETEALLKYVFCDVPRPVGCPHGQPMAVLCNLCIEREKWKKAPLCVCCRDLTCTGCCTESPSCRHGKGMKEYCEKCLLGPL